ncbi:hypothetical protein P7C70_g2388, partial [Phenoliferia sp. Uapishka_3]
MVRPFVFVPSAFYPHTSPAGEVPYDRLYESDLPKTNVGNLALKKPIYDLRPLVDAGRAGETNVDVTGFQLVPKEDGKTLMKKEDWEDDDKIRSTYYDETIDLLKKVTGATHVVIFDHTIRRYEPSSSPQTADTPNSRKPVSKVHLDQTPAAGRKRVYRHTGADADRLLEGRASIINLWRPLRGPVQDSPLAVADARTLKQDDLVASRLIYEAPTPEGETFQIKHSDEHRWYYLSEMQPDEAILLKCWDNQVGGATTPHSGFVDDKYIGKEVAQPRQSIEVRALVFHEKQ